MTTAQKARTERELQGCTDLLVRHYRPERILLFGSLTTGAVYPYSDIDLIVIKETDQPFWERLLKVHRLLQPELPLDLFVYTPTRYPDALPGSLPEGYPSRELAEKTLNWTRTIWQQAKHQIESGGQT